MSRLSQHVRSNAVAYLALFVALGGTSYAAIGLPAGSVGTAQLQNGAVTANKLANGAVSARKLDGNAIGGSVRHWASVSADGRVLGGSRGARVTTRGPTYYVVNWGDQFRPTCAVLTGSPGTVGGAGPFADAIGVQIVEPGHRGGVTAVFVFPRSSTSSTGVPFNIAVLC
jgi:hypothetical protein